MMFDGELPDHLLAQIGLTTHLSAYIEAGLVSLIGNSVGVGHGAETLRELVADDSWAMMTEKLSIISSRTVKHNGEQVVFPGADIPEDLRAQILELIPLLDRARVRRNEVVHSTWSISEDGQHLWQLATRGRGRKRVNVVHPVTFLEESNAILQEAAAAVQTTSHTALRLWLERSPGTIRIGPEGA